MLDESTPTTTDNSGSGPTSDVPAGTTRPPRKRAAKKSADPATKTAAKKTAAKKSAGKAAPGADSAPGGSTDAAPAKKAATKTAKKTAKKATATEAASAEAAATASPPAPPSFAPAAGTVLFQAPEPTVVAPTRKRATKAAGAPARSTESRSDQPDEAPRDSSSDAGRSDSGTGSSDNQDSDNDNEAGGDGPRKRRRRGGRGRRGGAGAGDGGNDTGEGSDSSDSSRTSQDSSTDRSGDDQGDDQNDGDDNEVGGDGESSSSRRRRRRRRRTGAEGDAAPGPDDPPNTVVRVRERRPRGDEITGVRGSTRLEAKKQRRREGREQGRRKQVITEAEFLARRESVERVMVVRQTGGRTQIGVLEDDVLVEHYVSRDAAASMAGNVYLGRVQNVLPSMEAAFVDIGKGRNAVLYAGEVNWDAAGVSGQAKRIENVLKSGESVLVQVTKDPIGHKGARLTSQISLPGRYLVYVPQGSMTGISRKLPENERTRLKQILKAVLPEGAGVIVRTAAEGASEEELRRDVERLTAQWEAIQAGAEGNATAPALLHGEPDLTVRVIRDVFNEDFTALTVQGADAWQTVETYVGQVAPDLTERVSQWTSEEDVFTHYRIDEQLAKALDRKVWLPSGGSLVIDRTEAMTVVDVNTGKFTGSGGNLEETVTKNNIEAAEEIVRQLRLRDVGGIIVIDFIDMVLESNRELVLRRLLECLGRDRTKHQVAEVTSLGLVQMTRKRVGQGLLEVFSETCEVCHGRGIIVHSDPVEKKSPSEPTNGNGGNAKSSGRRGGRAKAPEPAPVRTGPTAAEIAARAHAAAMHNAKLAEEAELAAGIEPDSHDHHDHDHDHEHEHEHEHHDHDHEQDELDLGDDRGHGSLLDIEPDLEIEVAVAEEPEIVPEPEPVLVPEPAAEPEAEVEVDVEVDPTLAPPARPKRRRGRATAPAGPPPPAV